MRHDSTTLALGDNPPYGLPPSPSSTLTASPRHHADPRRRARARLGANDDFDVSLFVDTCVGRCRCRARTV
jgi:hypothetical protein